MQEKKQSIFKRRNYVCEKADGLPIPLFLLKIPYTTEQLRGFPRVLLKRIAKKARRCFEKYDVETVFPTEGLEGIFPWVDAKYREIPMQIPDSRVVDALLYFIETEQVQQDTLHIFDQTGVCLKRRLLPGFCKAVRYLCIYTDEAERMTEYARELCDEYGVMPEVRPYSKFLGGRRLFVRFSESGNTVGLGNTIIDGMEPDLDFKGYPLKRKEVYAAVNCDEILPHAWFCGKKRLTS